MTLIRSGKLAFAAFIPTTPATMDRHWHPPTTTERRLAAGFGRTTTPKVIITHHNLALANSMDCSGKARAATELFVRSPANRPA